MSRCQLLKSTLTSLLLLLSHSVSASELTAPSCDTLTEWSKTIDEQERWQPFSENRNLWLPKAISTDAFTALFGKAAIEWTNADVLAARGIWNGCIQEAKKARDKEQQASLQTSRKYLTDNLRNTVRYRERQEQKNARELRPEVAQQSRQAQQRQQIARPSGLTAGVDQLLTAPASLESLFVLGSLSNLDSTDANAMSRLEQELGRMSGSPAIKAGYRIMRELRIRGTDGFETELPRIDARLAEVKPGVLKQLQAEFSQNPADLNQRRALGQRYEQVMKQLEGALSKEEYQTLADESRKARHSIVDRAVAEAKQRIDTVPSGDGSIAAIDRIVSETTEHGLDIKQRQELLTHAHARQRVLADEILADAVTNRLPALPESLAGIDALNALGVQMLQGVVQKADPDAVQKFSAASGERLAVIGRKALPEYRELLAGASEDENGLQLIEQEIAVKEAWVDMQADVRGEYVAEAKARRDQIAALVEKARAARAAALEGERREAIAAGGDARLVASNWIDDNKTMTLEFRDQETVFVNALGFKFAGNYKVSRDDVIVQGPHGQLVFTFTGDTLTGNGGVFRRRGN